MTLAKWITVAVAAIASPIIGIVISNIVKKIVGRESNPEALRLSAKPIASLFFSLCVVVGLIIILGVIKPAVVDNLVEDFVDFIPKILVALIILIGANVMSTFAVTALGTAMARMPFELQQKVNLIVKATIITMASLLAVGQIGVDTEVVNMAVGAILMTLAASVSLLIGLGGYGVARQVASTRAIKKVVRVADKIVIGDISGVVKAIQPTHVELETEGNNAIFVPSSLFLEKHVSVIDRAEL